MNSYHKAEDCADDQAWFHGYQAGLVANDEVRKKEKKRQALMRYATHTVQQIRRLRRMEPVDPRGA